MLLPYQWRRTRGLTCKHGTMSQHSWSICCSKTDGCPGSPDTRGWSKTFSRVRRSLAYSCNWDGSQYRYDRNGAIIWIHETSDLQIISCTSQFTKLNRVPSSNHQTSTYSSWHTRIPWNVTFFHNSSILPWSTWIHTKQFFVPGGNDNTCSP